MKHKTKKQLSKSVKAIKQAIKLNCYDCMGGQKKVDCEMKKCDLFSFRPWANKINCKRNK